jgi:Ni/Fe-hydrogenase 1 B-type cytochrome subunit
MFLGFLILKAGAFGVSNSGKATLKTIHAWIRLRVRSQSAVARRLGISREPIRQLARQFPGGRSYFHAVRCYIAAFIAGHPKRYPEHNPGGDWVSRRSLLIIVAAISGLVLAGTDLFYPPFGSWIAQWVAAPGVDPGSLIPYAPTMYDTAAYQNMRAFRSPVALVHLYTFYVLVVTIVAHVAAVVVTELRERGSIVSAMFTGRKIISGTPVDDENAQAEK